MNKKPEMKEEPEERKKLFEEYSPGVSLRKMIIPTVISQLIIVIYNLADTFYIGRTNNPYMVAGVSLILPIFNIMYSLAALPGVGGGTYISILLGEKKKDRAEITGRFCIWLSLAVGMVMSLLLLLFMNLVLRLAGATDNIIEYARQYTLWVVVIGGVPTVLTNVFSNLLRSVGMSRESGFGITMGGILNIILDPLFMWVILPPGNEVTGVAVATFLSNLVDTVYFIIVIQTQKGEKIIKLTPPDRMPCSYDLGQVISIGMPTTASVFLFDIVTMAMNRLMIGYGEIAMAAIGIEIKAERFPVNIGTGICQGMIPLVAYNFGAENRERMKAIIKRAFILGISVCLISIILYELFAGEIAGFFISESGTTAFTEAFIRIRILACPLMFSSFFIIGLFQAFGDGKRSLILSCVRWGLLNLPMLFIMNHLFGLYGIVWSQFVSDMITVMIGIWMLISSNRKNVLRMYAVK